MSAEVTARVLKYLFADLSPHLPSGVGVKVTPHRKWTIVQRADVESEDFHGIQTTVIRDDQGRPVGGEGSGVAVRNLAPSLLLIPRSVRRQIAAKHALDILLGLVHPQAHKDGFSRSVDYGILTEERENGVVLSYQLPGSDRRVELKPVPRELFG